MAKGIRILVLATLGSPDEPANPSEQPDSHHDERERDLLDTEGGRPLRLYALGQQTVLFHPHRPQSRPRRLHPVPFRVVCGARRAHPALHLPLRAKRGKCAGRVLSQLSDARLLGRIVRGQRGNAVDIGLEIAFGAIELLRPTILCGRHVAARGAFGVRDC